MVGGTVIEVISCPDRVWVNCRDRRDECAIYVERNERSLQIRVGDSFWWQGEHAMWTPRGIGTAPYRGLYDVKIPRIGYSGVARPEVAA